jgi:hypothetical protein
MSTAERSEIVVIHRGKSYTLWRRGDNLYLRLRKDGRAIWKTLGTTLKDQAVKQAKVELDRLEKNDWKKEPKKPVAASTTGLATVGEILDRYMAAERDIAPATRNNYISAMETLLRVVTGKDDPRVLSSSILSEETLDSYIAKERAKGRPDHSIHASLTQARCIISPKVMSLYKGLILPNLDGFRAKRDFKGDREAGFIPPTREEVIAWESKGNELLKARSPLWIVYVFMSRLALRNNEVARAKWSDISEGVEYEEGKPVSKRYLRVVGQYAEAIPAPVEISDDLWQHLRTFRPSSCTHEISMDKNGDPLPCDTCTHIVPAKNKTERFKICERGINDAMRDLIKGRRKIAYELRRWAGSLIYTVHGSDAARDTLRHASVVTVTKYYAKELKGVRSAKPSDLLNIYGLPATTPPPTTPTP